MERRSGIRRLVPALGVLAIVLVAEIRSSSAATLWALPRSDYPPKAHIAVVPATNASADHYLAPAHRSTFEQLHRLDGAGWLQFAVWHFTTGKGAARENHQTIFGYGIHLFRNHAAAKHALADIKLKTTPVKVAHLPALRFVSTDARHTLVFVFLLYKYVEVEGYYEYDGVAPAATSTYLRHIFSRQLSHLAHIARKVTTASATSTATPVPPTPTVAATPTPTATATMTATPRAMPTSTATARPTATAKLSPTPTPTSTATATPVPTATLIPVDLEAALTRDSYSPGESAVVRARILENGQPVAGVLIQASFDFPNGTQTCRQRTDQDGVAACSVVVPSTPNGSQVNVTISIADPGFDFTVVTTSFLVRVR